ncbi:MAG: hypothetical protein ACK5KU_09185 [Beutenbergiaceae bacterium]
MSRAKLRGRPSTDWLLLAGAVVVGLGLGWMLDNWLLGFAFGLSAGSAILGIAARARAGRDQADESARRHGRERG